MLWDVQCHGMFSEGTFGDGTFLEWDVSRPGPFVCAPSQLLCTSRTLGSSTCHQASQQENTYRTKYQKVDRASNLVTLWVALTTGGHTAGVGVGGV